MAPIMTTGAGRFPAAGGGGGASVLFDFATGISAPAGTGTSRSWTHTPVGTPTAVAVVLENYNDGATITGVTYGTAVPQPMTLEVSIPIGAGSNLLQIYSLANPPAGNQDVTITNNPGTVYLQAEAITVTGSNTTTAFTNKNSASGTGTAPSVAVTSATGDFVIDIVGTEGGAVTQTPAATLLWTTRTAAGNNATGSGKAATGTSTTMSWTLSTSLNWAHCAASFKA